MATSKQSDDGKASAASADGASKKKAVAKPKTAAAPKKAAAAAPTAAPKKAKPSSRSSDLQRAAERLKQVSDPTRLRVLLALAAEPRNVTQLRDELGGISQPALSHHLALLRHGRLIEPSRQGKTNVYDLTNGGRELAEVVAKLMP